MKKLLTLLFIGIASLYAQTVPSYVPTNGLVGWWPFNGNANDESGNGNNGSYVAGVNPTSDRNGTSNSAMGFSGQGSITLSNLPTTGSQDFTIAGWLSTSNASTARKGIACWGQDVPWQSTYFFVNTNGKLAFGFAYNAGPTSTASVNDAQWHFVSVTNTNGFIQLYVDGVPNGQGMQMSLPNIVGSNKSIGANIDNGGNNFYSGKLDDIAIWNRALTSSEILNIYNQINVNTSLPTYVPTNGLVGWWPFNGNANDESGNGNNGTNNGATLTADRNGNPNSAFNFNGISNFIEFTISNLPTSNQARSFSCWFYANGTSNSTTQQKVILNYGPISTNQRNCLMHWGTSVTFIGQANDACAVCTGSTPHYHPSTTVDSLWHNYIITYANDTIKGFLDGQLSFTSHKIFNTSLTPLKIGYGVASHHNGEPFFGKLDDIGIWNRALTTAEIQGLFQNCPDTIQSQPQNFTAYSSTGWANFKCESTDSSATYQWQQNSNAGWSNVSNLGNYFGANSDSLVITGVTASMNNYGYRCIVNGCTTDTSDVAVLTVVNGIGLGESALQKLTVSPNPTNGMVSLNISVVGNYELLTLDGRVLEAGTAKKDYDLTKYPKGVYHLRLATDEGTRVLKVVKN